MRKVRSFRGPVADPEISKGGGRKGDNVSDSSSIIADELEDHTVRQKVVIPR